MTNPNEDNQQALPGEAPLVGQQLLVEMMRRIDELQIAFRNLGRDEQCRFADLVSLRLMNNGKFMSSLAQQIVDYSIAVQQRAQSATSDNEVPEAATEQVEAPDLDNLDQTPVIGITIEEVDAPPPQSMSTEDGGTVEMTSSSELQLVVGFTEFPESTHRFFVDMEKNDDDELMIVSGRVLFDGQEQILDLTNRYGYMIINALNNNLQGARKQGRPEVEHLSSGSTAWFTIKQINFTPVSVAV